MADFEQRLWEHLVDNFNAGDIDMPTIPRAASDTRRRVTVIAGLTLAAASVAAAVVLIIGATTVTPPAYALVRNPDGSVTLTVRSLHTALRPINERLRALDIPERLIPINAACPRSNGGFVYAVERSQFPQLRWTFTRRRSRTFLARGDWGYIGLGQDKKGQLLLAQGAMRPPLPACLNSTLGEVVAPTSSSAP